MGSHLNSAGKGKTARPIYGSILLCIIDWQKFFVDRGSPAFIPETVAVRDKLRRLIDIFLKFKLPILATRHSNSTVEPNNFLRFYGRVLNQKSKWYGLADPLGRVRSLSILDKNTYSGFENPKLLALLKARGVKRIVLAGVQTERCVLANALAGFDRGFEMIVVSDACAGRNQFRHRAALQLMKSSFASIIKVKDIERLIRTETEEAN